MYEFWDWWIFTWFIFKHVESLSSKTWSTVNLEWSFIVLLFYLKASFDLEKTNQLGESSPNFIFVAVNLDPIVIKERWSDGESWPNNFVEKVNRGEDLRWVGSKCPLMHALATFVITWMPFYAEWKYSNRNLNFVENVGKKIDFSTHAWTLERVTCKFWYSGGGDQYYQDRLGWLQEGVLEWICI